MTATPATTRGKRTAHPMPGLVLTPRLVTGALRRLATAVASSDEPSTTVTRQSVPPPPAALTFEFDPGPELTAPVHPLRGLPVALVSLLAGLPGGVAGTGQVPVLGLPQQGLLG